MSGKSQSQRQLRVGERVRHILSSIFIRGAFHHPYLRGKSITVSQVKVSPDIRHATAYVTELGEDQSPELIEALNECAPDISYEVAQEMTTKYTPKISFEYDLSFKKADRIEEILDDVL